MLFCSDFVGFEEGKKLWLLEITIYSVFASQ
ncbi:unnamed protein product (plasmid) [Mycetohabitans rhizoxinica HKI 454]|uniref:Uncharacterized protein n=1 Tax=Mycetohabitans rhizoxinica (strain DSM 19002 / CIP 109453 / HKI 454) TaxID=882378 RepID=E5AVB9_MYCRK|nr:unnamed protein product [Mycetohabitans rhizoxinica HKI 454]